MVILHQNKIELWAMQCSSLEWGTLHTDIEIEFLLKIFFLPGLINRDEIKFIYALNQHLLMNKKEKAIHFL